MTEQDVKDIMKKRAFPFKTKDCRFVETHISWLILTDDYVYKFKRPVQYSFLDFSSKETRLRLLHRELELNRRLAPDIYISVLPVNNKNGNLVIEHEGRGSVDNVLLMKRMNEDLQLDLLLRKGLIEKKDMIRVADVLVPFHQDAQRIESGDTAEVLWEEFADLMSEMPTIEKSLGSDASSNISRIVGDVRPILESMDDLLRDRHEKGFVIDGHGDLHCRNIIMMDPPIIFDCLEFSDDLRQLDLLSEIAFLCMDLERFGRDDLSHAFLKYYLEAIPCIDSKDDERLFLFYKMHRAGIQLKISSIRYREANDERTDPEVHLQLMNTFITLIQKYHSRLLKV